MRHALDLRSTLSTACENTVPRNMVHRAAISEVFLTGAALCGHDHFLCAAQFPRTHSYFNDHTHSLVHYDLLLILEVFRQASIYICHAFLGVSSEDKFIYLDSDTHVLRQDLLAVGNCPVSAVVDVKVVDEYLRHGARMGVTLNMVLLINGQAVARHERMSIRWISDNAWKRMRAKSMALAVANDSEFQVPTLLEPSVVCRQRLRNIVIGRDQAETERGLCTRLIVDRTNPAIFDHPLDHIPGMLLLEGFRQTGLIAARRYQCIDPSELLLSRCKVEFTQFGEIGVDTYCHVNAESVRLLDDRKTVGMLLDMVQGEANIASAELELAPLRDAVVMCHADTSAILSQD